LIDFILNQIFFYFTLILVIFLPGYFLLNLVEARRKYFTLLEKVVISAGLGIIASSFIIITIGKLGISINKTSVILSLIFFILLLQILTHIIKKSPDTSPLPDKNITGENNITTFSKNQLILIILILFLTIFIKTTYLAGTIFPSATDLGHHTYWINKIVLDGKLPVYEKTDVIEENSGYAISQPEPIADFIIGEHLFLASISLVSGLNPFSVFPTLILFLINILSVLAIFILALRIFRDRSWGKNAAIFSLFLLGPLYAISGSQTKFVSGGVIGNILGNLLIPIAFYFFWRAIREKKAEFFSLALFISFSLFYVHHLSALIFSFIILLFLISFFLSGIIFGKKNSGEDLNFFYFLKNPLIIILLASCAIFFFFVYTPSYIATNAVTTIVGEATKTTKQGISFTNLFYQVGQARMAFALVGLVILFFFARSRLLFSFILSWFAVIFLMSWKPGLFQINIPSARVANYLPFPAAISAAAAAAWIFAKISAKKSDLPAIFGIIFFLTIVSFSLAGGFYDNSQSLRANTSKEPAMTYHAAQYLSQKTGANDVILKDHNFIAADSWMKIFFMKDYNYPLTRSLFFRYEENSAREHCTLWMISEPQSSEAQKCFSDLGVNFLVINPALDSAQFKKTNNFWNVYSSDNVAIFYKYE
jgi:hypothetical protein